MARDPRDPWHRRYYARANRPYAGCGCLYLVIVVVIVYLLLAVVFQLTPFAV